MEWLAGAVEASQLGAFARGSSWAYPIANLLHLLGLVLLIGGIGLVDLRLIGLFPALPLEPLARALTPVALAGLALMAISGPVMFAADAAALARSATFGWKLGLILAALTNALCFRWLRRRNPGGPSGIERLMAGTSLALWLTVAALGRMIAYN
jgi:hypothetical protein